MEAPKLTLTEQEQDKLLDNIEVDSNGCWLWLGRITYNGYGILYFRGTNRFAHRIAYQWLVGSIPNNLQCDHYRMNDDPTRCSRGCCNPDHIQLVSPSTNSRRSPVHRARARQRGLASRTTDLPEGVKGVRDGYMARIQDPVLGKQVYLGYYGTPDLASRAYREARVRVDMGLTPKSPYMVGPRRNKKKITSDRK